MSRLVARPQRGPLLRTAALHQEPASSARTHWLPGTPGITMMVADGGLGYGHHLGTETYRGGRSRSVLRIGSKAGTERARQGRFCDAAGGRPDLDRRAGGDGRVVAER